MSFDQILSAWRVQEGGDLPLHQLASTTSLEWQLWSVPAVAEHKVDPWFIMDDDEEEEEEEEGRRRRMVIVAHQFEETVIVQQVSSD